MSARTRAWAGLLLAVIFPLSACGNSSQAGSTPDAESSTSLASSSAGSEASWPRTITHNKGTTEIKAKPQNIVSTSITLTGTLLAIDAPVKATAATAVSPLTDDKGFFTQWASVADERGVKPLYPNLKLDMEAIEAAAPDLIVASAIGADSTIDAYDQLNQIAPTIVLDYGAEDWETLGKTLGQATGHEADAAAVVADFDKTITEQATKINKPQQPVAVMTYNKADGVNVFLDSSAQGKIMTQLGFTYLDVDLSKAATKRSDMATFTPENAPVVLAKAKTLFVIPLGGDPTAAIKADPLLANQPAVANGGIHLTPASSFRLDYYSSLELVNKLVADFPK